MAKKTIKAQMKQRRDTKANWAATNPVLLDGELGIVSDDPNLYKVGDGATAWNDLPFRGFDGTLAQELGNSAHAAISQKAVSEALYTIDETLTSNEMASLVYRDKTLSIPAKNVGYFANGTQYSGNGEYHFTDLIPSAPGTYLMTSKGTVTVDKIGLYDADLNFIGRISYNDDNGVERSIIIPAEAKYLRFTTLGDQIILRSSEATRDSIGRVIEKNIFRYDEIEERTAINTKGEFFLASLGYKIVKLFLNAGRYWITSPGVGSQTTLWKYTDNTYSPGGAKMIIGNIGTSISRVYNLEEGYYAFGWNDESHTPGLASITKSYIVGEHLARLYDSISQQPLGTSKDRIPSELSVFSSLFKHDILLQPVLNRRFNVPLSIKGVYYVDGKLYYSEKYDSSELLEVAEGCEFYTIQAASGIVDIVGFYDSDKNFMSKVGGYLDSEATRKRITIPSGCRYVRFSSIASTGTIIDGGDQASVDYPAIDTMFSKSDILRATAIKPATGELWNVNIDYKVAKIHITERGYYWLVTPGGGSQDTLWKYTDSNYSTEGATKIIGNTASPLSKVLLLEEGYYALGWNCKYNAVDYNGEAFLSKQTALPKLILNPVEIVLPKTIYAVVGDTLQLYYNGIIKAVEPQYYDIVISCDRGKQYPRYFEYTPIASDVGTTTFTVIVKDNNGIVLNSASCVLKTVSAPSSSTTKNIACIGDSLTRYGLWCKELHRRLAKTGGNPSGNGLSNIKLVGRMQEDGVGWFGVGGWSWDSYISNQIGYKFFVSGVTTVHVGDYYTNNGHTYRIVEVNITEGNGYISGFAADGGAPQASGTLTFAEGSSDGDRQIKFTASELDPSNPFWDSDKNKISFIPYADNYANGRIDVMVSLLSWNGLQIGASDFTPTINKIKQLIDVFHAEFPQGKWKLCGLQLPSLNGGTGANYGASGSNTYADRYALVRTVLGLNKAYKELAALPEYSDFVEFVCISAEFDSLYNMPYTTKAVNTRNQATTEIIGTNGVHPSGAGYNQIADTLYRNLIAYISE